MAHSVRNRLSKFTPKTKQSIRSSISLGSIKRDISTTTIKQHQRPKTLTITTKLAKSNSMMEQSTLLIDNQQQFYITKQHDLSIPRRMPTTTLIPISKTTTTPITRVATIIPKCDTTQKIVQKKNRKKNF